MFGLSLTNRMVLLLAALVISSGVATAQGPRWRGEDPPARGPEVQFERMKERLELSDEQVTDIEKIREEARKDRLELQKQLRRLHNQLEGEMLKDIPSQATVNDLTAQIGEARTGVMQSRLAQQLAIRGKLTSEQRDKMMMGGFGTHGGGPCRKGHGDRPGPRWRSGHKGTGHSGPHPKWNRGRDG